MWRNKSTGKIHYSHLTLSKECPDLYSGPVTQDMVAEFGDHPMFFASEDALENHGYEVLHAVDTSKLTSPVKTVSPLARIVQRLRWELLFVEIVLAAYILYGFSRSF